MTWVLLQLKDRAEDVDPAKVAKSIRHILRGASVYVPAGVAQQGSERAHKYLFDGYAFVEHRHPEEHYQRLVDSRYVDFPVRIGDRLATVSAQQIADLRAQAMAASADPTIGVGDTVVITAGVYSKITAIVVAELAERESLIVHMKLRSLEHLVTLPRGFLRRA